MSAQWNRVDICRAYWTFAYSWHGGQGSETYAIFARLERIGFNPSPVWTGRPDQLDRNARAIYQRLVERRCGRWSTVVSPRRSP